MDTASVSTSASGDLILENEMNDLRKVRALLESTEIEMSKGSLAIIRRYFAEIYKLEKSRKKFFSLMMQSANNPDFEPGFGDTYQIVQHILQLKSWASERLQEHQEAYRAANEESKIRQNVGKNEKGQESPVSTELKTAKNTQYATNTTVQGCQDDVKKLEKFQKDVEAIGRKFADDSTIAAATVATSFQIVKFQGLVRDRILHEEAKNRRAVVNPFPSKTTGQGPNISRPNMSRGTKQESQHQESKPEVSDQASTQVNAVPESRIPGLTVGQMMRESREMEMRKARWGKERSAEDKWGEARWGEESVPGSEKPPTVVQEQLYWHLSRLKLRKERRTERLRRRDWVWEAESHGLSRMQALEIQDLYASAHPLKDSTDGDSTEASDAFFDGEEDEAKSSISQRVNATKTPKVAHEVAGAKARTSSKEEELDDRVLALLAGILESATSDLKAAAATIQAYTERTRTGLEQHMLRLSHSVWRPIEGSDHHASQAYDIEKNNFLDQTGIMQAKGEKLVSRYRGWFDDCAGVRVQKQLARIESKMKKAVDPGPKARQGNGRVLWIWWALIDHRMAVNSTSKELRRLDDSRKKLESTRKKWQTSATPTWETPDTPRWKILSTFDWKRLA